MVEYSNVRIIMRSWIQQLFTVGDAFNETDHHSQIVVGIFVQKDPPSALCRHMEGEDEDMKTANQQRKIEHVLTHSRMYICICRGLIKKIKSFVEYFGVPKG